MTFPLVLVKQTEIWDRETDFKTSHRVVEPLIVRFLGEDWLATGERNDKGHLVYRMSG